MEIHEYINHKKELNEHLISFIDGENEDNDCLIIHNYFQNKQELEFILNLILQISDDHHRGPLFFSKIEEILLSIEKDIKQHFSNSDLFDFFSRNKRILLFLIQKEIITLDKANIKQLMEMRDKKGKKYCHFFYQEIVKFDPKLKKSIDSETMPQILNNILYNEEYRYIGENDSYICKLIREDSVEEFISYCTKTNVSLNKEIQPSIYETNPFLLEKKITLIEYAAFFGSIQIFKYLNMNYVKLNNILWLCAIHSKNPEIIHLLEENKIEPPGRTYEKCIEEAIKCHHNDIAEYIEINLLQKDKEYIDTNVASYCLHYFNFKCMPDDIEHQTLFFLACQFNCISLVNFLLKTGKIDINAKSILNKFLNTILKI